MSGRNEKGDSFKAKENYEQIVRAASASSLDDYEDVVPCVPPEPVQYYEDLIPDNPKTGNKKNYHRFMSLPAQIKPTFKQSSDRQGVVDKARKHLGKDGFGGMVVKQVTKAKQSVQRSLESSEKGQKDKSCVISKYFPKCFRRKSSDHAVPNEYHKDFSFAKSTKSYKRLHRGQVQPQLDVKTKDRTLDGHTAKPNKSFPDDINSELQETSIGTCKDTDLDDYLLPENALSGPRKVATALQTGESEKREVDIRKDENDTPKEIGSELEDLKDDVYEMMKFTNEANFECVNENKDSMRVNKLGDFDSNKAVDKTKPTSSEEKEESESHKCFDIKVMKLEDVKTSLGQLGLENDNKDNIRVNTLGDRREPDSSKDVDTSKPRSSEGNVESENQKGFDITVMKLEDVKTSLEKLGLEEYADLFMKKRIDGRILSILFEAKADFKKEFNMSEVEIILLHEFVKSGHIPS